MFKSYLVVLLIIGCICWCFFKKKDMRLYALLGGTLCLINELSPTLISSYAKHGLILIASSGYGFYDLVYSRKIKFAWAYLIFPLLSGLYLLV